MISEFMETAIATIQYIFIYIYIPVYIKTLSVSELKLDCSFSAVGATRDEVRTVLLSMDKYVHGPGKFKVHAGLVICCASGRSASSASSRCAASSVLMGVSVVRLHTRVLVCRLSRVSACDGAPPSP